MEDRRRFRHLAYLALGILPLLFSSSSAYGQAAGTQAPAVSGQSPKQSPPEQAAKQRPLVSLKDGSLTVQAQDISLRGLVENIAAEARIAVQFAGEVADQKISVAYKDVPVESALQQILKQFDAFYFYGVDDKPPARLQIVWVYPKTKGRGLEPVPPEQWASTKELKEQFASKDAATRAKAIGALVERLKDGAQDDVVNALRDPDAQVRTRALYKAGEEGLTLPQGFLASLAVSDESSYARFLALDGLSGNREMQPVVERALNDPDQYVQAKAKEILERWRWADQVGSAPQPSQAQQQIQLPQGQQGQTGLKKPQ